MLFRFIAFPMIMVHSYCSLNIFDDLFKCLRLLKSCFHAILYFPSHLQENLKKHTHTPLLFFEKSWATFFLKPFFFFLNLQFNSRISRAFYFCEYSLSEAIRGILLCKNEFCKNIYLPKYIFRKNLFL